jgi:hypothetical protein
MISAVDVEDRARQLISLTERLTEMLAAEAAAFEQRRGHTVVGNSEEMGRLANLYRHESVRVKADPRLIAGASLEARRRLLQATEAFEAVLARHGRALNAAKRVTEGLVQAIAEEVASTRAARTPYGPGARTGQVDASAITLNKRA